MRLKRESLLKVSQLTRPWMNECFHKGAKKERWFLFSRHIFVFAWLVIIAEIIVPITLIMVTVKTAVKKACNCKCLYEPIWQSWGILIGFEWGFWSSVYGKTSKESPVGTVLLKTKALCFYIVKVPFFLCFFFNFFLISLMGCCRFAEKKRKARWLSSSDRTWPLRRKEKRGKRSLCAWAKQRLRQISPDFENNYHLGKISCQFTFNLVP